MQSGPFTSIWMPLILKPLACNIILANRSRCWTEWTENQIRASFRNGCKCLIQEIRGAPGELEFPTLWLPRQTVPVKFALIKSFRFKEWCAQGDDFRTFLGDFVTCLPKLEFPPGLSL